MDNDDDDNNNYYNAGGDNRDYVVKAYFSLLENKTKHTRWVDGCSWSISSEINTHMHR